MPTRQPNESRSGPSLGRPLRILHLEDHDGTRLLVKTWIDMNLKHPFELVQCENSRDAVQQIRQGKRFDVAISDVRLDEPPLTAEEEKSGIPYDPIDLLAHLQKTQNTHPILLTGLEPKGRELVQAAGLKVIIKGEPKEALLKEIRRAIEMRARHEEEKHFDAEALAAANAVAHLKGGRRELIRLVRRGGVSKEQIRRWYAGEPMPHTLEERIAQLDKIMRQSNLTQREINAIDAYRRRLASGLDSDRF